MTRSGLAVLICVNGTVVTHPTALHVSVRVLFET
jgi:hypothetical protein